jgi:hypothetical protein
MNRRAKLIAITTLTLLVGACAHGQDSRQTRRDMSRMGVPVRMAASKEEAVRGYQETMKAERQRFEREALEAQRLCRVERGPNAPCGRYVRDRR